MTIQELVSKSVDTAISQMTGLAKEVVEKSAQRLKDEITSQIVYEQDFLTRDRLRTCLGEVYDWFQPDEIADRPITDILIDLSRELKADREECLLFAKIKQQSSRAFAACSAEQLLEVMKHRFSKFVLVTRSGSLHPEFFGSATDKMELCGMVSALLNHLSKTS